MAPRRTAVVLAALLAMLVPTAPATAGVVTVRSLTTVDAAPDVVFGGADADGQRRIEVELLSTDWSHVRVRRQHKLRVRAHIDNARPSDDGYRQGLVVEAWRAPKGTPPRLVAYAVVFDRSSGVWATRPDGRTTRCPAARRTRSIPGDALVVTLPVACLRLRGRMKLVAVTNLDAYGIGGWGRAATDRSVLSRAMRFPRRLR